jgi:hypothetical protein
MHVLGGCASPMRAAQQSWESYRGRGFSVVNRSLSLYRDVEWLVNKCTVREWQIFGGVSQYRYPDRYMSTVHEARKFFLSE